jgi:hypothetical protein
VDFNDRYHFFDDLKRKAAQKKDAPAGASFET